MRFSESGPLLRQKAANVGLKEEMMSQLSTLISSRIYLGKVSSNRLPELLDIEEQVPTPCWGRPDLMIALEAKNTGTAVAEMQNRIFGFALYKIMAPFPSVGTGSLTRLVRSCWPWRHAAFSVLELDRIAVHPDWRRQGIGCALLKAIHEKVRPAVGCVRATVPESNLPVQLLLRNAGYRAIRILPCHYGAEDGFVMQWQRS